METVALVTVAALAAWQAVEVWRHSAIMATRRERVRARGGFAADLLGCPYCLSVWAGGACYAAAHLAALHADAPWARSGWGRLGCEALRLLLMAPVGGLAASRLANLGNDLTHGLCRTPRADRGEH